MHAAVYSFSVRGALLSKRIGEHLRAIAYDVVVRTMPKYAEQTDLQPMLPNHKAVCKADFPVCQLIVFVGAVGIAVRTIAPHIRSKDVDPAVICVDEQGRFVIPLLAGHIGGANEIARYLATALDSTACVTTATDVNGLFAVDEWAARNNMVLDDLKAAKRFAAALVAGEAVGLMADEAFAIKGALPEQVERVEDAAVGMAVTLDCKAAPYPETVRLLPRIVHLGIGCRRNTPLEKIEALVLPKLAELHTDMRCVVSVASVDLKKDEQGLLAFAAKNNLPANFYTAEELEDVAGEFTPSAFVKSVVGVSNVCERSAVIDSGGGRLILRKTSMDGVTLAVAIEDVELDFSRTGLKKN